MVGEFNPNRKPPTVLDILSDYSRPVETSTLAKQTGETSVSVSMQLRALEADGKVTSTKKGQKRYWLSNTPNGLPCPNCSVPLIMVDEQLVRVPSKADILRAQIEALTQELAEVEGA